MECAKDIVFRLVGTDVSNLVLITVHMNVQPIVVVDVLRDVHLDVLDVVHVQILVNQIHLIEDVSDVDMLVDVLQHVSMIVILTVWHGAVDLYVVLMEEEHAKLTVD